MNQKMKILKLNDVFPQWIFAGGIFSALYEYASTQTPEIEIPFLTDTVTAQQLDTAYHGGRSGNKTIAPLLRNLLNDDNELTPAHADLLCGMIWCMFGTNLLKQFATLSLEYNPIENYNMIESSTDTHTGTDTDAHTGTISDSGGTSYTDNTYGFDSASPVPQNSGNTTNNNTRTHLNTDTTTHDTATEHSLSRSGNIGVTTSQQMLESERNLWMWNFYNNFLFPVFDSVLTLPIYN